MADTEETTKATIVNTAPGPRGIRPVNGYKHLEAGESYTGEFSVAELASARMTDGLRLGDPDEEAEGLAKHTVAELRALAGSEGIDLGDAHRKADIIAAIELAREA